MRTSAGGTLVPSSGVVEFRAAANHVVTPEGTVTPGRERALLDDTGHFSVELTATDIGNPADWTWTVLFGIAGFSSPPVSILVPSGSVIDISTVVPVGSSGGVPMIVGPPGPAGDGAILLDDHIADPTPHPAYDDIPSLVILFENGIA